MPKTITYLYPENKLASKLKIYQDKSSQVRAFMFTRSTVSNIKGLDYCNNYAIYFLISNDNENNLDSLYIGQSENGIKRIENHVLNKDFWSTGIMFITENNSFDKMTIDYLEWKFIQIFKESDYILDNKDLRLKKPNISIYDQPVLDSYVDQIIFLLSIEGVNKKLNKKEIIQNKFSPSSKTYKNIATLIISDGKFYLAQGSIIRRVDKAYNKSVTKRIDTLIDQNKIQQIGEKLVAKQDILCKSPSGVSELITGAPSNGWLFFEGLDDLRRQNA